MAVGEDYPGPKRKIADSRKEFARYLLLCQWQRDGLISGLVWQQTMFCLHAINGATVCRYKPDAVYVLNGRRIVEDVKGRLTELYKLKRRWMREEYGISIVEV